MSQEILLGTGQNKNAQTIKMYENAQKTHEKCMKTAAGLIVFFFFFIFGVGLTKDFLVGLQIHRMAVTCLFLKHQNIDKLDKHI